MSKKIEEGIFNYTVKYSHKNNFPDDFSNILFKNAYKNKLMNLYINLDKKSYVNNKKLLTRLKKKELEPESLAFLSPKQLFPDHWKVYLNREKALNELEYSKYTGNVIELKCSACGHNKCSFFQLQTRSCDEPITTFYTCLNCGKKWKN